VGSHLTRQVSLAKVLPVKKLSLNIDLGELPDESDELYSIATMVNIACGGHAGDDATMARALVLARNAGARIAAHPSYPDRDAFGRKSMRISVADLKASLRDQMGRLEQMANGLAVTITAVKPHGALYHDAAHSAEIAEALITAMDSAFETPVALVGPPHGALHDLCTEQSRAYEREGFADRTYLPDGKLAPRSQPDALITDPLLAASQALRLARSGDFETMCVHGDTPGAVEIARAVRRALEGALLLEGQS
jgi:5-oxoprolinase (ATP-hydrolysing) subunit A